MSTSALLRTLRLVFMAALPLCGGAPAFAQSLEVESVRGSTMEVITTGASRINRGSTLRREGFMLHDPAAPARITGEASVDVQYQGGFQYYAVYNLQTKEPLHAVEVRAMVFDVFGRPVRTLAATDVLNIDGTGSFSQRWAITSESEAVRHFRSFVYIEAARTASGRIYRANRAAVLEQIRRVAAEVTPADLDPVSGKD